MDTEEDDELEELLRKKRELLLKKFNNVSGKEDGLRKTESPIDISAYLTESARKYLEKKFNLQDRKRIEDALRFLIKEMLVEKPIDIEAVAFISRRVLRMEYKIYVEDEGELKEI